MPLPERDQLGVYARKGVELGLRTIAQAPEQRAARRLAADSPSTAGGGPRVMILSPRDWAAHVQYEAVIGHGLRARGADVRFLGCGGGLEICDRVNLYEGPPMPCRQCRRYVTASLDAHGFPLDLLADRYPVGPDAEWPELDLVPASELFEVELDGVPFGRLVEIPVKWFLCAAGIEADPLGPLTARRFLRSARRIHRSLVASLDEHRPDVVLLLNGLFLFEGIAWELCRQRGIDVVTYERAFLKETLVFSRDVPAGFYDLSAAYADEARPLTVEEDAELEAYLADRRSGNAMDQFWRFHEGAVPEPAGGHLVTLFTNLTWDTAVIGRDLAFPDIRDWLATVVELFAARPQHELVIRVHPSELALPGKETRDSLAAFVAERFPTLPPNVTVVPPDDLTSSYPLMERSALGLVYTSTTGLELALTGTPVLVAGATHYRGKGFTLEPADPAEFERLLDAVLADPEAHRPDVRAAREYAHFFFFRAPVRAPYVTEPLPGLARVTATSAADLQPGASADLDRICDLILGISPATPSPAATR